MKKQSDYFELFDTNKSKGITLKEWLEATQNMAGSYEEFSEGIAS
jgi:hypothetical protein